MAAVSQDSAELKLIAEEIRTVAKDFLTKKSEFFNEVYNEVGEEENKQTWYGPNASRFLTEFDKTKDEFQKAYDNIVSLATNLDSQADSWERFESETQN